MKEIFPAAKSIRAILGAQKKKENVEYRLLAYCAQEVVPEGVLLYNTMTKAFVLLDPQEAKQMTRNEKLIRDWFLVPEGTDDKRLSDQLKAALRLMQAPNPSITGYTIFTTTDCNARCFYCYEKGRSRIPMREETALQVVDFIRHNCGGHKVKLHWFGGEPLYNSRVIDLICQGLRENNIEYTSGMISNGYLFDDDILAKAVDLWKLKQVQITLDGTEEVYNRSKAFIYREGSPFRRVVDNIGRLLDARIHVSIRLNMDLYNAENLFQLVDELAARFRGRQGLTIYSRTLYEDSGTAAQQRSEGQRALVYEKQMALQAHIAEQGFPYFTRLRRGLSLNQCMADNDGAVTILPEGDLGRCEHFSESEFIGHINSPQRDQAMIASWKELCPPMEECASCVTYPMCIRLKKCEEGRQCFPETRVLGEWRLKQSILAEYQHFLSGQKETEETETMEARC